MIVITNLIIQNTKCPCFLQKKIHRFSLGLRSFANIEFIDDFKNMKGMNTPKGQ